LLRLLSAIAAAAAAIAILVTPAAAVQGGTLDGNGHPYVGMSVFLDKNGVPLWRCSGTLISPTVYLTAGHCTGIDPSDGAVPARAEIWFGAGPIDRGNYPFDGSSCAGYKGYPCKGDVGGMPHPNPGWTGFLTLPNTHDDGVVVLDRAQKLGYATLAPRGYLDVLAKQRGQQNVNFTIVGYGVQFERPNLEVAVKERYVGTTQLQNLTNALADGYELLMTDSGGSGTGGSGTCFGDSGGPVFHTNSAGQELLVADISFGTKYCKGQSGAYRTDTDAARSFLGNYVQLP
jgi:Trypsin